MNAGASNGIGAEIAVQFANHGSRLAITGRNKDRLEATAGKCVKAGLSRGKVS